MISGNIEKFNSPIRQITGKVELLGESFTTRPSKNLFKPGVRYVDYETVGITAVVNEDKSITYTGTATGTFSHILLGSGTGINAQSIYELGMKQNVNYTLSTQTVLPTGVSLEVYYYTEEGTLKASGRVSSGQNTYNGLIFTTSSRAYIYLRITEGTVLTEPLTIYPMIEEGSVMTNYEPYGDILVPVAGQVFTHDGDLVSFSVDKTGEDKFFGYGISQKLEVKIRDKDRQYNISNTNTMKPCLDDLAVLPLFNVRDVKRDENTNALTITAYDCIENAAKHTWSDLSISDYTLAGITRAIAAVIGANGVLCPYGEFNALYEDGINVEGTESLREILNDIAEATQTIYYMDSNNNLVFKRLGGDPIYTIDKSQYFTLKSEPSRTLAALVSATELGDNVEAVSDEGEGETQYIRDNVFWTEDAATKVEAALANVGGTTITPFDCSWRGCYLLEPGDKIDITTKDNGTITTYLLNDKLTYNGGMKQHTHWTYGTEEKTAANPSTLGEALKQTFAKVDKANKQIDLVVSETSTNSTEIAALKITTSGIDATVSGIKKTTDDLNGDISTLTQKVEASMTEDKVEFKIQSELAKGVDKVKTTEKNFTFDDEGLSISSSESNISTTITEDGMAVSVADNEVLTANNEGVKAIDLHATTYLIIGKNSRFEDYGSRTACFWIGG